MVEMIWKISDSSGVTGVPPLLRGDIEPRDARTDDAGVEPDLERALNDAEELVLVTRGRRSGAAHAVPLRFAYDEGAVWLRTEPREAPREPSATVVVRRRASRLPDWYRNLRA